MISKTSGWITLPGKKYKLPKAKYTYCQNECTIAYQDVKPSKKTHICTTIDYFL